MNKLIRNHKSLPCFAAIFQRLWFQAPEKLRNSKTCEKNGNLIWENFFHSVHWGINPPPPPSKRPPPPSLFRQAPSQICQLSTPPSFRQFPFYTGFLWPPKNRIFQRILIILNFSSLTPSHLSKVPKFLVKSAL